MKNAVARLPTTRVIWDVRSWYGWVKLPLAQRLQQDMGRWRVVIRRPTRKQLQGGSEVLEEQGGDLRGWVYRGLSLWELCKSTICDRVLSPVPDVETDRETILEVYRSAARLIDGLERAMSVERPAAVVVEQGLQYDMRCVVEVARRHGVRTVAVENSFLRDYVLIDDASGAITNRHTLARSGRDLLAARRLDRAEREAVHERLRSSGLTFEPPTETPLESLPSDKKWVLLIGQVATDAAVVMDSPLYEDPVDFIRDVAEAFVPYAETHHLVIRLHPKEAEGFGHLGEDHPFNNSTLRRLEGLGIDQLPHVTVFHSQQVNTYRLMDACVGAVVLTSQAGLEFLTRHKPAMVAGDAFYRDKGFTIDLQRREDLEVRLRLLLERETLSEIEAHAVDRFLGFLLDEYLFRRDLVGEGDRLARMFGFR
ncbi:MAG: hypothetical protein AAF750_03550 [Planctomycetota bacterium]